jgi:replicative DNA helicase
MAESYLFIESGIILNTRSTEDFHNCAARIGPSDFVVCRDVFQFMVEYVEQYDRLPPKNLLYENYPDILDTNAIGADLDYCVRAFEKQRLSRQAIGLYQDNRDLMISDPENAISNVLSGLERLNLNADKSLLIYNDGSRKRLEQFHERRNVRNNSRFKIIGIPTPLRSINRTGVGLLPGELCGLFARPGTGKSWFVIKAAAICAHLGYKTLFVSPEMPDEQMSLRLDVMLGRLKGYEFSHSALKTGGDIDEASYAEFLEKCDERSLFVCDNIEGRSVTLAGIARLVRKHRPDVLIVDNMEILSPG